LIGAVEAPLLVDADGLFALADAGLERASGRTQPTVLTPHAGSGTQATRDALGQFVVDNLAAFFAGRPLVSPVGVRPY